MRQVLRPEREQWTQVSEFVTLKDLLKESPQQLLCAAYFGDIVVSSGDGARVPFR
ncbi:MAG: hypothetical protein Greene041662_962 [Candidatus Peregrinibacteria bacterium Greene0416_62]|nr:MAG: hypothetical protein Greene041662_962 [Candidatus Peregrinibacteria bacterium Greene0416_62]